jgi:geranylgeranyl pyrophosphate synthase
MIVKLKSEVSLNRIQKQIESQPQIAENYLGKSLKEPAYDLLNRQGKGIRAEIIQLAYAAGGGEGESPQALRDFVELLHAGSLVIDDIQDNASTRRGKPSLHLQYGVPVAINTGNWLYFEALEQLNRLSCDQGKSLAIFRKALRVVKQCHEGQALDLALRFDQLPQAEVLPIVTRISKLKTGALTGLAAWLGAMAAGCEGQACERIANFGLELGTALQMQNDYVELRRTAVNQTNSLDLDNRRVTWPWGWLSVEVSAPEYREAVRQASLSETMGETSGKTLGARQSVWARTIVDRLEPTAITQISEQLESAGNLILPFLDSCRWQHRFNQLMATLELRDA